MCIWALQSWISDTLFPALAAVFVTRFLAIRFRRVAVKRRAPIVVNNCLIDPAVILPLLLIVVDLTLQIYLIAPLISSKSFEKLTIQSARQRTLALPCRDSLSYADILNRGIGHSRSGRRVRFSPSLSSRLQNLYVPYERLCIALRLSPPLPLLIGLLLLLLLFL